MNGTSVDIVWEPAQLSSLDCWDYSMEIDCLRGPEDLQLAAELGKTLLERNKELENCIKLHQCTIEDQAQEIEYMKKQTTAQKEANNSRLKILETLETSVQDLERANERLAFENANDKKTIKNQTLSIDNLEAKYDDLQKKYDELNTKYESLLRQQSKNQNNHQSIIQSSGIEQNSLSLHDDSIQRRAVSPRRTIYEEETKIQDIKSHEEDVTKILQQLQDARSQRSREQKKCEELKEKLESILQEHALMEEQLNEWKSKASYIKNLQEEVNALQEVRQGQLCGRCLRGIDSRVPDDYSAMMLEHEEEDEISLAESFAAEGVINMNDTSLQVLANKVDIPSSNISNNPYRDLVEKYEALLKIHQQQHLARKSKNIPINTVSHMSLQEELQMSGEFHSLSRTEHESHSTSHPNPSNRSNKNFPGTCTPDFSEAETSSSGFSDETSNKSTQTESIRPGSFLCSIADGEDCQFSIYDDYSNFRSRFKKNPEYRELFSEIFNVLKRAAVAKDEGEALPLLDESTDSTPKKIDAQISSVSGYSEDANSETTYDDTGSVVSLAVSSVVSEPVFRVHSPVIAGRSIMATEELKSNQSSTPIKGVNANKSNSNNVHVQSLHTNTRRQPLEYLSVQVRRKNAQKRARKSGSYVRTPDVVPTTNPQFYYNGGNRSQGRNRRSNSTEIPESSPWNGTTTHYYQSKYNKGRNSHNLSSDLDDSRSSGEGYKASEELAKLRRLEMSYAEALKTPHKPKGNRNRRR